MISNEWNDFIRATNAQDFSGITLTPEQMRQHQVPQIEPAFEARYPESPASVVYEFNNRIDAEKARVRLLTSAWGVGRGRVTRIKWQDRWRVIATP